MTAADLTIGYHMGVSRTQTLVQLNDALLARLDERAARESRSRSALIREAIEGYLHDDVSSEIDRSIAAGYRRFPQTAVEDAWAEAAAREAIREEPW
jgi:predicted transcriptional regulator